MQLVTLIMTVQMMSRPIPEVLDQAHCALSLCDEVAVGYLPDPLFAIPSVPILKYQVMGLLQLAHAKSNKQKEALVMHEQQRQLQWKQVLQ